VSCPSAAGCWALGVTNNNAYPVLIRIGPTGRVIRSTTVRVGVIISALSCVTMRGCEVAGATLAGGPPFPIEIGSWNGHRLRLRSVGSPHSATQTMIAQISCYRSYCVAVGTASYGSEVERGAVLTISHGRPLRLRTVGGDLPAAVSCVSLSLCYAAGALISGPGFVLTLRDGVASARHTTPAQLTGIACAGKQCTAVGQ
jgi:hypothetical protein